MNARGTRRPHSRRVRPKRVRARSGRKANTGCVVLVFMLASPWLVLGALVVGAR